MFGHGWYTVVLIFVTPQQSIPLFNRKFFYGMLLNVDGSHANEVGGNFAKINFFNSKIWSFIKFLIECKNFCKTLINLYKYSSRLTVKVNRAILRRMFDCGNKNEINFRRFFGTNAIAIPDELYSSVYLCFCLQSNQACLSLWNNSRFSSMLKRESWNENWNKMKNVNCIHNSVNGECSKWYHCLNLCERRRNWFRLSYIQKANHLFPISSHRFLCMQNYFYTWNSDRNEHHFGGAEKNSLNSATFFLTLRVSVIKSDTDFHNMMIDTSQNHRCGKIISLNARCCWSNFLF